MLNKVMLIGNLGGDPEVRFTPQGTPVCTFSIATNEKYKKKNGETETKTEWHKIIAFGKLAEICGELLKKGSLVYVEGKLQTREWKDSQDVKRYTTEVVISGMRILPAGNNGDDKGEDRGFDGREEPEELDDIPF